MARTIDSILSAHEAASERRKAGKPIWDYRLHIKHLLGTDSSPEAVQRIGKQIAAILRASAWAKDDGEMGEVALLAEAFEEVEDVDEFNGTMGYLYDLADADRVWVA